MSIPWPCTRKSFSENISIYIRPKNSQFRNQKKKVAGDSIKDSLDFHASVFFLCASKICLVGHLLRNLIASVEQLLGTRLSFLRPAFFFKFREQIRFSDVYRCTFLYLFFGHQSIYVAAFRETSSSQNNLVLNWRHAAFTICSKLEVCDSHCFSPLERFSIIQRQLRKKVVFFIFVKDCCLTF